MSRMNEPPTALEMFQRCSLVCISVCLIFSLVPFEDFEFDGQFDSFMMDGLILNFIASAVIVPEILFGRFLTARPVLPRLFSSLIVPPPIV